MPPDFTIKGKINFEGLATDTQRATGVLENTIGRWFKTLVPKSAIGQQIEKHLKRELKIMEVSGAIQEQFPTLTAGVAKRFATEQAGAEETGTLFNTMTKIGSGIFFMREGIQTMVGSLQGMAKFSPLMASSMELLNKTFELIMRPIGDIFGMFIRPLAIALLRFIMPMYKVWINFMSDFQTLFAKYVDEGSNKIVAGIKAYFGAVAGKPGLGAAQVGIAAIGSGVMAGLIGKLLIAIGKLSFVSAATYTTLAKVAGILGIIKLGLITAGVGLLAYGAYRAFTADRSAPNQITGMSTGRIIYAPNVQVTIDGTADFESEKNRDKLTSMFGALFDDEHQELRRRTRF